MKIFSYGKDGGPESTVDGFFIIEIKSLFSIVFLRFNKGSREAFHTHAFNALTFFLKGHAIEEHMNGEKIHWKPSIFNFWKPKYTSRKCFHKYTSLENTYAVTIRGPWIDKWKEYLPHLNKFVTLTHGRRVVK